MPSRRPDFAGLEWNDVEGTRSRPADARFKEYVALVHGYRVDGYRGRLRLDFVNDRLMAIWFYPENFADFVEHIRRSAIRFERHDTGEEVGEIAGTNTFIRIAADHQGQSYVAWEDEKVRSAVDHWIMKNS